MPYWSHNLTDASSETRTLARSLLAEAMHGPRALPPRPTAPMRGSTGRTVYWTQAHILEVLAAFAARVGRLPRHAEWKNALALGIPTRQTVVRNFGSLEALRKRLGGSHGSVTPP